MQCVLSLDTAMMNLWRFAKLSVFARLMLFLVSSWDLPWNEHVLATDAPGADCISARAAALGSDPSREALRENDNEGRDRPVTLF